MAKPGRRHLSRGGEMHRVADPDWADPLDVAYATRSGGRWNPPGQFGVLYLNASTGVARANVDRLFEGLPYGPEDLDHASAPLLISVDLAVDDYVDAVTAEGLSDLGLPATYPVDARGSVVPHSDRASAVGRHFRGSLIAFVLVNGVEDAPGLENV